MCTIGVLRLSCEAPAAPKPPGLRQHQETAGLGYLGDGEKLCAMASEVAQELDRAQKGPRLLT